MFLSGFFYFYFLSFPVPKLRIHHLQITFFSSENWRHNFNYRLCNTNNSCYHYYGYANNCYFFVPSLIVFPPFKLLKFLIFHYGNRSLEQALPTTSARRRVLCTKQLTLQHLQMKHLNKS